MSELFTTSGEKDENASAPTPQLQGMFVPSVDNPLAVDGFGIVTPWGGGSTARRYGDYGISAEVSRQSTQLNDLAIGFIPGGGATYNLEGLIGPPGIQGIPGADGTISVIHEYVGLNSNFLTALPHNIDLINQLGTSVDQLIYTNTYYSKAITWTERQPKGDANGDWYNVASDSDGTHLIAVEYSGRLYTSADSGATWTERQPAGDTNQFWHSVASDSDGSNLIAAVYSGRLYTSADSGATWTERQPTGVDLCSGTTDGDTLPNWGAGYEEREITFGAGTPLTSGEKYEIVVRALDAAGSRDDSDALVAVKWNVGTYADGDWYRSTDSGDTWTIDTNDDAWFKTKAGAVEKDTYEPTGTLGYEGAHTVNWIKQTFTASSSYTITSVILKMERFQFDTTGTVTVSIRRVSDKYWRGVASDSDGTHLIAGVYLGRLYTSADSGATWTERQPAGDTDYKWFSVASDSDGSNLIAGASAGKLYTSADSGATWTERQPAGVGDKFWRDVASDSDGTHLIAGIYDGRLYTSANSGVNWTERQPAGDVNQYWEEVASDSDGTHLIAGPYGGRLWTSADSGATWTERQPAGDTNQSWQGVALDSDGDSYIVAASGERLYTGVGASYSEATWAESTLTSAGRALLDDATTAAQRTTLGLGTGDSPTFTGLTLSGLTQGSVVFAGASGVISQDNSNLFWDNVNKKFGVGTPTPNAPLEVKGAKPAGNVGGFQSGMLHVTGAGTAEFSNSVITGHSAYNTNTQLWYLGSLTVSNNDIGFINRQNAAIHFSTNNTSRMTIDAAGNVTLAIIVAEGSDVDKFLVDSTGVIKYRTGTQVLSDIGGQASDAGLTSLAGLVYASDSFIKVTATDTYAIRTIAETKTDLSLNLVENTALSTWVGTANITTLGTIATGTWASTDVGIAYGGTGQSTAQLAINALSAVSGATNEHVLTKDTATGNAIFKVAAGGGGGMSYTDRGDPATADFTQANLTMDNTWRDLSLSGVIGTGVKLVHLNYSINDNSVSNSLSFRQNGNSNARNISARPTQVSNVPIYGDGWVLCDADGVVEYRVTSTATTIDITVRGWFS